MSPDFEKFDDNENASLGKLFGDVTRLHFLYTHQHLAALDLGKGQPPILRYLTENNGCIQSDIAKREKKAPATITVMLKTMEKNDLIERRSDPEDLRTMRVYITKKGRETNEKVKGVFRQMDEEIFSVFTDEEYEEFARLMKKMGMRIDNLLHKNGQEEE